MLEEADATERTVRGQGPTCKKVGSACAPARIHAEWSAHPHPGHSPWVMRVVSLLGQGRELDGAVSGLYRAGSRAGQYKREMEADDLATHV
jgi:hypothetical protein